MHDVVQLYCFKTTPLDSKSSTNSLTQVFVTRYWTAVTNRGHITLCECLAVNLSSWYSAECMENG